MLKENPKTVGSGMVTAIPQSGPCPFGCDDCYANLRDDEGKSLAWLDIDKDLPLLPDPKQVGNRVVRVNDLNDSFNEIFKVMELTEAYHHKFYNTSVGDPGAFGMNPVVFTINPGNKTDFDFHRLSENACTNIMFVRVRANLWNGNTVIEPACKYYGQLRVPIVLTFMRYYDLNHIPSMYRPYYHLQYHLKNPAHSLYSGDAYNIFLSYSYRYPRVYVCGEKPLEGGNLCVNCGNCLREYFRTANKLKRL